MSPTLNTSTKSAVRGRSVFRVSSGTSEQAPAAMSNARVRRAFRPVTVCLSSQVVCVSRGLVVRVQPV